MAIIERILNSNQDFVKLMLEMRVVMASLNKTDIEISYEDATLEANGYFSENRQVFGIYQNDEIIGYSVLKTEDNVCWLDWLYVKPEHRGSSIASDLFDHAEAFAKELGNDELYIWVHPDNQQMLKFLKKKGYDLLNLIEVKKEKPKSDYGIDIFGNKFRY
jgi:ribosomal protein S18 acetylase RimI-like enzyme